MPNIVLVEPSELSVATVLAFRRKLGIVEQDKILRGGFVSWLTGLTFRVTSVEYIIADVPYSIFHTTTIVLDPADPALPRIDTIVVDTTPQVTVIKGVPATNPIKPVADPLSQLERSYILIPAGATVPGGVTSSVIYNENAVGEYAHSESGVIVDYDSLTAPLLGTKCAETGFITNGNYISFIPPAPVSLNSFSNFITNIKLKGVINKYYSITVQMFSLGLPVTNEVKLQLSLTDLEWQTLIVPSLDFSLVDVNFDEVRIKWKQGGAAQFHLGFFLDATQFELGVPQPLPAQIQADYNQMDPLMIDYIKNKPDLSQFLTEITKELVEAVLTGEITTHTHPAGTGGEGTVTSVDMSVPTGFAVTGGPITAAGVLALAFANGYSLPSNASQSNWNAAYSWGDHELAGYLLSITKAMVEAVLTGEINSHTHPGGSTYVLTKEAIEEVFTGLITTHYHTVSPPGISTVMNLEFTIPIEKYFKPTMIVNKELDQFRIPTVRPNPGGTLIAISAIDIPLRTMTLINVPLFEDQDDIMTDWLVSKSIGTEPSRSGQDQQYCKVSSWTRNADQSVSIVWASTPVRSITGWVVGTTVFLINIKRGWSYNMDQSTFKLSNVPAVPWKSASLAQGGFFKDSNGNIRLIVTGNNANPIAPAKKYTIGLAWPVGNDPTAAWELDADSRINHNHFPAWCNTTGFVINTVVNHPTLPNTFIGYGCTYDTIRRVGYVVFNADMSSVQFSTTPIIPGDTGFYQCSVVLFEGKYRMFLAELNGAANPDAGEWSLGYYESLDPLTLDGWVRVSDVNGVYYPIIRDIKDCARSSHSTEASLFTYNGELYGFIDGTSRWNAAGNRGQRAICLMKFTGNRWVDVIYGPVFAGYQFADIVWNLPPGHTGGIAATMIHNGDMYLANALTVATDQYKIVISRKLLTHV